ncbi:MAG: response regulator transcription factor [Alkalinema sp. RU_4_3]|nr:response regulator transcription factor [Alkalinema sp. RU_4_3]
MTPLKLLLVDDQPLIRRGLKALFRTEPSVEVIAEAENGYGAIEACELALPDVVLMDIRMPQMDGVAATGQLKLKFPTLKVLILTTFDDRDYVTQALQEGAAGYLLKDTPLEELIGAIHLVHKGYTQLAPGIAQKLLEVSAPAPAQPSPDLTPREWEILTLIAQGASNREIAQSLYISEKTVKNHITSLLGRLGLRDRTQAAIWFHGLGSSSIHGSMKNSSSDPE